MAFAFFQYSSALRGFVPKLTLTTDFSLESSELAQLCITEACTGVRFLYISGQLENASTFHVIYARKGGRPVMEKQDQPRMLYSHALSDESNMGTPRQQWRKTIVKEKENESQVCPFPLAHLH